MGGALAWVLLLLQAPGCPGLTCEVFPEAVNWSQEFGGPCLNLSGRALSLPQDQPLRAPGLQVLDLSGTGLRGLPAPFLAQLGGLRTLILTDNRLDRVDAALAARCGLALLADCACALAPWYRVRRDNCSGQEPLRCLLPAAGAWHNLSSFLGASCGPGLAPAAIGTAAAGGVLLLALAAAGPVLAWRLWGRRRRHRDPGKTWAAQDAPRRSSGAQPRYSSRGLGPQPATAAPRGPSAHDYENVIVGQPWPGPGAPPADDGDLYVNYQGRGPAPQPVYGNLGSLAQASLDEDEYAVAGC